MSDLTDLYHFWGSDLTLSPSNGLLGAQRFDRTSQRLIRRLLTNPGGADYLWQPEYGGGLLALIGTNATIGEITARINGQVALEPSIAQSPAPIIILTPINGGFAIYIFFYDETGNGTPLSFNLVNPLQ
jgi:hypothetical protein